VVHVVDRSDAAGNAGRSSAASRRYHKAILKDVTDLAERYEVQAKSLVRYAKAPDNTILKLAREGEFDLIILGVNRRPGDELFFGQVAAKVLEKSKCSTLVISGSANTSGESSNGSNGAGD